MIRTLLLAAASLSALIDSRVTDYADAGLFSGVVLVAKGNVIIYQRAFGFADRIFKIPNRLDTKFHIASVSKPMTSAAVLLLADRGKLSIDDPVSKFVPDFPNGNRITIEQLITHRSGLGDASSQPDYNDWSRFAQTPASLVEKLAKLPLRSEPGTQYSYSNSNYHLLALIIEKASGMAYGDFLAQNIFKPLGMTSTAHHATDQMIVDNLASGYMPKDAADWERPPYFDWTSKTGNGSLFTTAGDLLKFRPEKVLKPESASHVFWYHQDIAGHKAVYMNGSSPGFKADLHRFPDDDVTIIVLANVYLASPNPIAKDIASLLFENRQLPPVPKPVSRGADDLRRVAGTYQFASNFYQPNVVARIEARDGYLLLRYPTFDVPLTPLANGEYFDRLYWSFVRFDSGKMFYRNGSDEFAATSVPAPESPAGPATRSSSGGTPPHTPRAADAPRDRAH